MKKFEKIVIATDLDGTFFSSEARLVERNLRAVKYFTDNGGHFTIATGRFPYHVRFVFSNVEEYVNMPAATCNGSCIYDFSKNEELSSRMIPSELMVELERYVTGEEPSAALRASSTEHYFTCTPEGLNNPYVRMEFDRIEDSAKTTLPVDEWLGKKFYKTVIRADEEVINRLKPKVAERFRGRLYVTQSAKTLIDIQLAGCDKGKGLRELIGNVLGEGYTLYTCGDYINDLEMHAAADVSVCPSNAHPDVKAVCKLCFGTNDDGLIADLVEYLDRTVE
ncbi:MAG: HAD-IIB family hydrolase [Ruminococcaceae bacterium]|nr:HAD-IIB family hydrolase [Oscillospiraceae bacterium]